VSRVLIVDDEEQRRTMGLQSLSSFGSSAYDYVNGLSSMVQFFGGGL
jgi:hypothetical protein